MNDRSYKAANNISSTALEPNGSLDSETAYKGASVSGAGKIGGRYERLDAGYEADEGTRVGRRESRIPLTADAQNEPVLEMGRYPTSGVGQEGHEDERRRGRGHRPSESLDYYKEIEDGSSGARHQPHALPPSLQAAGARPPSADREQHRHQPREQRGRTARLGRDELGFERETGGVDTRYVSPVRRGRDGANEF